MNKYHISWHSDAHSLVESEIENKIFYRFKVPRKFDPARFVFSPLSGHFILELSSYLQYSLFRRIKSYTSHCTKRNQLHFRKRKNFSSLLNCYSAALAKAPILDIQRRITFLIVRNYL